MENTPKLKIVSNVDKFAFYFGYAVFIAFFIYFLAVFKENPVLISIFLFILFLFFLLLTYNQIKVYFDKIEIIQKGLFKFNTSIKTFYFDEISSIETTLRIGGESGILIQLIGIFRASVNLISWNEYIIILKEDKRKTFNTQIESEDLIKVFQLVEKLSGNKIKVTGLDQKIPLLK
jgi:hypothetical protein